MHLTVVSLAARPDLVEPMWDVLTNDWPPFMREDPVGGSHFGRLPDVFPEHQFVALDGDGRLVGKVHSIPFSWERLPDRGWDAALERGFADRRRGVPPTGVSLLEARLEPGLRGAGLSGVLLDAVRQELRGRGVLDVVAPVRPTAKASEPRTPMAEYARRTRDDGLPADPWMRVHARLGARVVQVCPLSMCVPGTLEQWRAWTGLPFDRSGEVEVPGALVPVQVQAEHGTAVYVEPNVWMHHDLR